LRQVEELPEEVSALLLRNLTVFIYVKVKEIVDEIWDQFDTDNSGRLNKKETKIFLNVLLQQKGKKQTSNT
jgi:hypothetical protein